MNAQEGQYVEEGELLIELDAANAESERARIEQEIAILTDEADVYSKLISGTETEDVPIADYSDDSRIISRRL